MRENLVPIYPHVARAYSIALLGGFSIQIVFDKSYTQGFEDYEAIKKYFYKVRYKAVGDIIIEITKPDYALKSRNPETLDNIHSQVSEARKRVKPTGFKNEAACEGLLKVACERLSFSITTRENVMAMAKVIARLDNALLVEVQHVAEAIQYKAYTYEGCNAENASTYFGKGIEIAQHALEPTDVKNAIEYLKSLLKNNN